MLFKNILSAVKIYGFGIFTIIAGFQFILTFKGYYVMASSQTPIPDNFWFTSTFFISGASYFFITRKEIFKTHLKLEILFLDWVKKLSLFQLFVLSVPINFLGSITQFILISMLQNFTSLSEVEIASISFGVVNLIGFFILRTYIFQFQTRNYEYLRPFIIFWVIIFFSVGVNALAVKGIIGLIEAPLVYSSFEVISFNEGMLLMIKLCIWLVSLIKALSIIVGNNTITAQFLASTLLGWVWFSFHNYYTFPKENTQERWKKFSKICLLFGGVAVLLNIFDVFPIIALTFQEKILICLMSIIVFYFFYMLMTLKRKQN